MKVIPYLQFNGNCAEATAFYEKVFGVKAEFVYYKDAPPSYGYQPVEGTENLVMHAQFKLGDDTVMFCDMPPEAPVKIGNNIAVSVSLDNIDSVKSVFEALKAGGKVGMEPQETFWSKCFASLEDKFGIGWMLSFEYCNE
ncbi:MAG: VOC family protein [Nitrososphaerota archaeon]|nr:VOC family protein [Nitrososphaerota archaeon]